MSRSRPIGHIAGNLTVTAINISYRVRIRPSVVHVCWLGDDGCIHLQHAGHTSARAVERCAPHQVINRFRQQPEFGWRDIEADLQQARIDFAAHAIREASAA